MDEQARSPSRSSGPRPTLTRMDVKRRRLRGWPWPVSVVTRCQSLSRSIRRFGSSRPDVAADVTLGSRSAVDAARTTRTAVRGRGWLICPRSVAHGIPAPAPPSAADLATVDGTHAPGIRLRPARRQRDAMEGRADGAEHGGATGLAAPGAALPGLQRGIDGAPGRDDRRDRLPGRRLHRAARAWSGTACMSSSRAAPGSWPGGEVLARLGPGDFFGELAVIDQMPRQASVIADEPVTCLGARIVGPHRPARGRIHGWP